MTIGSFDESPSDGPACRSYTDEVVQYRRAETIITPVNSPWFKATCLRCCARSDTPSKHMQTFGQCRVARYCSNECQVADWNEKSEAAILAGLPDIVHSKELCATFAARYAFYTREPPPPPHALLLFDQEQTISSHELTQPAHGQPVVFVQRAYPSPELTRRMGRPYHAPTPPPKDFRIRRFGTRLSNVIAFEFLGVYKKIQREPTVDLLSLSEWRPNSTTALEPAAADSIVLQTNFSLTVINRIVSLVRANDALRTTNFTGNFVRGILQYATMKERFEDGNTAVESKLRELITMTYRHWSVALELSYYNDAVTIYNSLQGFRLVQQSINDDELLVNTVTFISTAYDDVVEMATFDYTLSDAPPFCVLTDRNSHRRPNAELVPAMHSLWFKATCLRCCARTVSPDKHMQCCPVCAAARYCSAECQTLDWKETPEIAAAADLPPVVHTKALCAAYGEKYIAHMQKFARVQEQVERSKSVDGVYNGY